jgi:hypothetical protein
MMPIIVDSVGIPKISSVNRHAGKLKTKIEG